MKASLAISDLLPALEKANRAVATKTSIQMLTGFRLEVTDMLAVTGNNVDIEITTVAPVLKGRKRGAVLAVTARQIIAAVKTLPKDATVTLETAEGGSELVVTSGRSTMRFDTMPAADYPTIKLPTTAVAELDYVAFADAYQHVANNFSTDESRPVLVGVKLEFERGRLRLIATDSYRLGVAEMDADVRGASFEPLIQGSAIGEALRVMKGAETVSVLYDEEIRRLAFSAGGVRLSARMIEGQFPNWRQLIPDPEIKIHLHRQQGVESCDRILKLSESRNLPVRVRIAPGEDHATFTLAGNGRSGARVSDAVDAEFEITEPLEIGVHPTFLGDALAAQKDEYVQIGLISPLRPILVGAGTDRRTLVMPIRLA